MSSNIEKIAADAPAILHEAAREMRKLAEDNVELSDKVATLEHTLRVHKLAMRMDERGLEENLSLSEKVASLSSLPDEKLAAIEAAVELVPGGFKLASLRETNEELSSMPSQNLPPGELGSSAHYARLDSFIVSGQAHG
jgi:vacuolar-type H+-ATPase subunit E/Vma4